MKGFKMSADVVTWDSKNALKMRLEEEKTQVSQSLTNLGEVLYSKYQFYYFKDSSPPFIGERTGHELQRSLQRKLFKVALQLFHF